MVESSIARLQQLIHDVLKNRDNLINAGSTLKEIGLSGDSARVEAYITEKLAPYLNTLVALVEASDDEFESAIAAVGVSDDDRAAVVKIRGSYKLFKPEVQSANLYEQGYLHRITGVRYRPHVFVLSATPAIDITLRSFDRNVLRTIDTLDNTMGLIAGLADAVATAYEKSVSIGAQITGDSSKRFVSHLTRASQALERIKGVSLLEPTGNGAAGPATREEDEKRTAPTARDASRGKRRRKQRGGA